MKKVLFFCLSFYVLLLFTIARASDLGPFLEAPGNYRAR